MSLAGYAMAAQQDWIWVEGEIPVHNSMHRHPWYDQVKRELFSGGDFISNFDREAGEAEYRFEASGAGRYEFWVRANPLMARMGWSLNGAQEVVIDLSQNKRDETNVAADGKPDLRFLAWIKLGNVDVKQGANAIRFRMLSENNNHGYLDCFVLSRSPFQPRGLLKPDQLANDLKQLAAASKGWLPFSPQPDTFADSPIDLRWLNEKAAGEHGFIGVKSGEFVHTSTAEPIRFWAVNGPPRNLKGDELRRCARMLAKRGVNLVRIHGGYFDQNGDVSGTRVQQAMEIVEAMKAEGIYSLFSIYFPLWLQPKPDASWLEGYDGRKHPFATLFFNPEFQEKYRQWWTALLGTRNPANGKTLLEEPAVAALEIQNEDSFFFWTFSEQNIPDPQLRLLEKMFGDWLRKKYGSIEAAFAAWKNLGVKRDQPAEGRVGFRPLWAMFNEKTTRDQDTAAFLFELQKRFYSETYSFLRKLGFKGVITASNWTTASPEVFGPLEKWSYTACDFVDRHGYFSCNHKGENAEWSVRNGHTYSDRSALRFDPEVPGKPRIFVHPAMDTHYDGKPSMLSESTWNRPNRYRGEAPLYFAVYGALQHSDAIAHFALDSAEWEVKPGFYMQPWTLMSPTMVGQFPAAALIFRQGLITTGPILASVNLNTNDLLRLQGTPLAQEAALDELRLKDIPAGTEVKPGGRIDPLVHYAGRTEVRFTSEPGSVKLTNLAPYVDHAAKTVSSATGELRLDYGKGVLVIDAAKAQGASGSLGEAGTIETGALTFKTDMDLAHVIAVSLDGAPLSTSTKILLQVMSEEKPSGFETEPAGTGIKKIVSIGTDPWMIRELKGTVAFKRPDADRLRVTALDYNGFPVGDAGSAKKIQLQPGTLYYVIGSGKSAQ